MVSLSPPKTVRIKTSLPQSPLPPNSSRQPIYTERMLLRPLTPQDLGALHVLRTNPETMQWTLRGVPDPDVEYTRGILEKFLPPNDTLSYNWAICSRETGDFIGVGGMHLPEGSMGWPELGYMLGPVSWGKGYATEFLKGFLEAWWALPREMVELSVEADTVVGQGEVKEEMMSAMTGNDNPRSQRVLEKAAFKLVKIFEEDRREMLLKTLGSQDNNAEMQKVLLSTPATIDLLYGFTVVRPAGTSGTE